MIENRDISCLEMEKGRARSQGAQHLSKPGLLSLGTIDTVGRTLVSMRGYPVH